MTETLPPTVNSYPVAHQVIAGMPAIATETLAAIVELRNAEKRLRAYADDARWGETISAALADINDRAAELVDVVTNSLTQLE